MISDHDIELLEAHLDGQLDASERADLERRLAVDLPLARELEQLAQSRELRMRVWQSYEPSDSAADGILAHLQKRQARRAWYVRLLDQRQRIAAAAACVAVFMIGWQWGQHAGAYRAIQTGTPAAQPVGLITQQQIPAGQSSVFEVRVTDSTGRLVRTERFGTLAEAQTFIDQVQREMLPGIQP